MAATLKLGDKIWATQEGSLLAYNSENNNYKPLPFDFTRASSATRVNKQGLIETVASGVPRIDFTDANGALLLEPQRTNLITYSEDFTSWSNSNITATNDLGISPDGTLNAAKLTELSGTSTQYRSSKAVSSASAIHTFSCYVKRISGTRTAYIDLGLVTGFFNFDTETMYSASGVGTFENAGNGWYRIRLSHTTAATLISVYLGFGNGNTETYTSTGGAEILFWGIQIEAGSYATSYIPTQGSAVTVVADVCSQTPPSGIIGQTEGTVFVDFYAKSGYDTTNLLLTLSDGTSTNYIYLNRENGKLEARISDSGVTQLFYLAPSILSEGVHKLALAYKLNDFSFYLDGVLIHSDTNGTFPSCNKINLGSYYNGSYPFNDRINDSKLYNTRLSNAELATLTSL